MDDNVEEEHAFDEFVSAPDSNRENSGNKIRVS